MCRWFDSAPGHQIANPNSYELGFFIGRSGGKARGVGGLCGCLWTSSVPRSSRVFTSFSLFGAILSVTPPFGNLPKSTKHLQCGQPNQRVTRGLIDQSIFRTGRHAIISTKMRGSIIGGICKRVSPHEPAPSDTWSMTATSQLWAELSYARHEPQDCGQLRLGVTLSGCIFHGKSAS